MTDEASVPLHQRLLELHTEIDRDASRLLVLHRGRLQCRRGCHDCCRDGVTIFEVEAERIRRRHGSLLSSGRPHAAGACAFLDDAGACRIYDDRPYVCRTQGLPLRWLDEHEGRTVELRDICPLNDVPGQPIEELDDASCWTLGPAEGGLATLQSELDGGQLRRVPLRDLFRNDPG